MKVNPAVKNPLSVIAIFAGLAEVAGTVVLPFVADANEITYIWFLMLFPTLLVVLFFLTLNFNPKVLYAPSDFRDESNYMEIFRPSSTSERLAKLDEEVEESPVETMADVPKTGDDSPIQTEPIIGSQRAILDRMRDDPRSRYMLAENLIIDKISSEFKSPARREVALSRKYGRHLFDAVFEDKRGPIIVEIKFLSGQTYARRMRDTIERMRQALSSLPDSIRLNMRLLLAFAHELPPDEVDRVKEQLEDMALRLGVPAEIRMYAFDTLVEEAGMK